MLPAHLDAIRLSVLPMAIGLDPLSIFIYEGDKLCAKKERSEGFGCFANSNEVYQLSKPYLKIQFCTAIGLLTRSLKI